MRAFLSQGLCEFAADKFSLSYEVQDQEQAVRV
jgi:hypothetical protein